MTGWLYILRNDKTGRYYVGSTSSLERIIKQHKNGHTRTTKILKTFTLAYTEEHDNILEARLRERQLISYKSRKYLDDLVNSGRIGINKTP